MVWSEPPAGSVISWRTLIGAQAYTYVAVRIQGSGWYLTGQVTESVTWAQLCAYLPPVDGRFLLLSVTGQLTLNGVESAVRL